MAFPKGGKPLSFPHFLNSCFGYIQPSDVKGNLLLQREGREGGDMVPDFSRREINHSDKRCFLDVKEKGALLRD
ncbi:hypothetical protein CEXT_557311 [Caerostris extrusa]|uniref:Uncharacterized protein n=1 Tax=Caerostris extrusa TaxID=172846 RepID=A0AAV4P2W0_CAEEX|nr:hypothetical protein CEXT_557311 [Caerostris extrusa]